jgi:hypothetical protein
MCSYQKRKTKVAQTNCKDRGSLCVDLSVLLVDPSLVFCLESIPSLKADIVSKDLRSERDTFEQLGCVLF